MEREYRPLAVIDTHHFAAKALLVRGEMWLAVGNDTLHIVAGGTFELGSDTPHSERCGSEGAAYWVGRRAAR